MIRSLLRALRIGASVQNPTPLKWAGVAVAVAIIALEIAKSYGVLSDVTESSLIELVMAALVLYSQIASTEKIGVLPSDRRSLANSPRDLVAEEIRDALLCRVDAERAERMRDWSVPTDADEAEPKYSRRGGLPDGAFFDS